jgi:uncharacterized protein (TIGR03000 family)
MPELTQAAIANLWSKGRITGRTSMRKLLLPVMVAAAMVLPATVWAQHGGHGGGGAHVSGGGAHVGGGSVHVGGVHVSGGGAHVGGAHVSGGGVHVSGGGAHVSGFYGGARGYGGYGYGHGYSRLYGYSRPYGYYGSGYAYPAFGLGYLNAYSSPASYAVYPTTVYSPSYYSSTYVIPPYRPALSDSETQGQGPVLPNNRAQIQVILPDPEATLSFDGGKTTSVGKVRLFDPPELQPGVTYSYKVTASWVQDGKTITDVRKVPVMGGRGTLVDFTQPAPPEAVPAPKQDKQ